MCRNLACGGDCVSPVAEGFQKVQLLIILISAREQGRIYLGFGASLISSSTHLGICTRLLLVYTFSGGWDLGICFAVVFVFGTGTGLSGMNCVVALLFNV